VISFYFEETLFYLTIHFAFIARESPTLKLMILLLKTAMATTVEPLNSVLISLSRRCLLVFKRSFLIIYLSYSQPGAFWSFFMELF